MRIFSNKNLYMLCILFITSYFSAFKVSAADTENDPFEKTNRAIFEFNNTLDDNFFKPVAKAWRKVPDFPQETIKQPCNNCKNTNKFSQCNTATK